MSRPAQLLLGGALNDASAVILQGRRNLAGLQLDLGAATSAAGPAPEARAARQAGGLATGLTRPPGQG
jgi:hypothetical protein